MTTDKPDLAKLADAVEEAHAAWNGETYQTVHLVNAVEVLLAARRSARASGYVECLLSREAVEALRLRLLPWGSHHPCCEKPEGQCTCGEEALARDLAALLKETP